MGRKILFLYNPHAGKAKIKAKLGDILEVFTRAGYEVTAYPTQYRGEAALKTEEAAGYEMVVCGGGDGTLDETVTGMMHRLPEERLPIGYLPCGSTNDFAKSLGISQNIDEAAETAANGKRFPCDVGSFNKDYFVYIAAFGIFTDVSYETGQQMKNALGYMAYLLEGVKRLTSIKSYRLRFTWEGGSVEDTFVFGMVTNSRSVGGFKNIIGKEVVLDDGVFEVTFVRMPKNILELNEILGALALMEINEKYMYSFKTDRIVIEAQEEIPWTLDGEFGGEHRQVEIVNRHRAVELMV